jgi:perosamine synthetase
MMIQHSKPSIDHDDIEAVVDVLNSGNIAQGEKVEEFEENVTKYVGVKHGVAVSSGTTALHLALIGLGIGPGDEVIIPSYVCTSPYLATLYVGATPIIVDINKTDYNISENTVKKAITHKTKAIIVPHMFGNPAELDELLDNDIPVIEDCAQSLGATYRNRKVGSFGKLSICSFYATKLITTGEGGMILTNDDEIYGNLSEIRQYDKQPLNKMRFNYKLTDFQAALGLSQLKKIDKIITSRRKIAKKYDDAFKELEIKQPEKYLHKESVFYRYIILLGKIESIRDEMKKKGVACEKPVSAPLPTSSTSKLNNTEYVFKHALSIPIYPNLTDEQTEYVINSLKDTILKSNMK